MAIRIRGEFPNFDRAAAKAKTGSELEAVKAGFDLVAEAKKRVPVRTGALRSSISASVDGGKVEAGPTAFWGKFVELGTSRMPPQPYLIPAAEMVEPKFRAAIEAIGQKALE